MIDQECAAGVFSLRKFYARRIRRIAPALIVTLAATLVLGIVHGLPAELAMLGKTTVAALLSVSNIFFWRHSGYFDSPAQTQPLLHTWSLSIEEQFYLFLPLGMILLYRALPQRRGGRTLLVAAAAVASFALAAAMLRDSPTATFYLLPTRAWELLLGALVWLHPFAILDRPIVRNMAAGAGAALIVATLFTYTTQTPFPGVAALPPCAGAACIIAAGQAGPTAVGRALSLKPLVFVGLISYSLYLWHWPIIVFQNSDNILISQASPATEMLAVAAASFAAAVISWRFIERPFRSRQVTPSAPLFGAVGGSALLVGGVAAAAIVTGGLPSRFTPEARHVAAYLDYDPRQQFRAGTCMISSGWDFGDYRDDKCLTEVAGKKNYLLLGDSHAAHLWRGLVDALPLAHVMQATASGCRPLLHAAPENWGQCRLLIDHVFQDFLPSHPVDAVLMAAKWEEGDLPGLALTLDWAKKHGVKVVLFGPIVQYDAPVPRLLASALSSGDDVLSAQRLSAVKRLDGEVKALAAAKQVPYVSLWDVMCRQENCMALSPDGRPLQFDYGHVTTEGSILLAKLALEGTSIDEGVR